MSIEITRFPTHYQVVMGLSTYLFTPSDYDALWHAFRGTPASDVVWQSCVTANLVPDPEDCGGLIDELDDFVDRAVWEHGEGDLDRCRLGCVCSPEEKDN